MSIPPPAKKRGPKCPWDEKLGYTVGPYFYSPQAVKDLLHQIPVKRLLNRMATDQKFRDWILKRFQEKQEEQ